MSRPDSSWCGKFKVPDSFSARSCVVMLATVRVEPSGVVGVGWTRGAQLLVEVLSWSTADAVGLARRGPLTAQLPSASVAGLVERGAAAPPAGSAGIVPFVP